MNSGAGLSRQLGLLGLTATGICSMLGAGIYVVPFMIQRNVPGIGPYVLVAFAIAAVPALLAAGAYAILASAMPRAGGSYIYASRGLTPYLGFVASFSQWFGLCIAIGVISYVIPPFLRDISEALAMDSLTGALDNGPLRLGLALTMLWVFVAINIRGVELYEKTLVPLMGLMFVLGAVVIVIGFSTDSSAFRSAIEASGSTVPQAPPKAMSLKTLLAAAAVLFSSFIGFDSIAQAGGEAKNPNRTLPLAIGLCILTVGAFYMLFAGAVYHAVPWEYIAAEALERDVTAPGLLSVLLSPAWTVVIIAGAAIALLNDLPAMLLSVSRLMFAWAGDGIFPKSVARVHPVRHTPHIALVASGTMASIGILGSHFAGDFFLGVDLLVTSMLVNFLIMCLAVLALPHSNPELAAQVRVFPKRAPQLALASSGILLLGGLLVVQVWKDLAAPAAAWYFRSTPVWCCVLALASLIYAVQISKLRRSDDDVSRRFKQLPPE